MKALVWFGAPLLALTVIGAASYLVVCDTSKADVDAAQVSLVSAEATGDGCCAAPEATSVALKTEAACPVTGATKVAHAAADAAATCPHGPSTKAAADGEACAHAEQTLAQVDTAVETDLVADAN